MKAPRHNSGGEGQQRCNRCLVFVACFIVLTASTAAIFLVLLAASSKAVGGKKNAPKRRPQEIGDGYRKSERATHAMT